jgi:hypothetical protein
MPTAVADRTLVGLYCLLHGPMAFTPKNLAGATNTSRRQLFSATLLITEKSEHLLAIHTSLRQSVTAFCYCYCYYKSGLNLT